VASKLRDNQLLVIDDLSLGAPKTKDMAAILKALGCHGTSLLVTTVVHDNNVYKSARNIAGVSVAPVEGLNAFAVLAPRKMLVTKAALDTIRQRAATGSRDATRPAKAAS